MERFHVLHPFLDGSIDLPHLARQHQRSLRPLPRGVSRYAAEGWSGLVRQRRTGRGGHRRLPRGWRQLIEGLALQTPPLSLAAIPRQICALARQPEMQPPSDRLVDDLVRQLPAALTTLAHQGATAYPQRFDLLHRREAEAPHASWQADHCRLDRLVLRDRHAPAQPWRSVILDDDSRALAGDVLTFDSPSALNTSLARRQARWRQDDPHGHVCGLPQPLDTDGGSDVTSQPLEHVSADRKLGLSNSIPGQPRGRGRLERFLQTVQPMLLCEFPGSAPPQGPVRGEPRLTRRDLDIRFRPFVFDVYHARPPSAPHVPPQQRWEAGGVLPQRPDSLAQVDVLLLPVVKPRKVRREGRWFLGLRSRAPTLAASVGASVILRYDPRDVSEVRVFDHARFLCRALGQELAGATGPLREIMKASNRTCRDLRQTRRDRVQGVASLLSAPRGHPSAADALDHTGSSAAGVTSPLETPTPRWKRDLHESHG
jgi:putative transposase